MGNGPSLFPCATLSGPRESRSRKVLVDHQFDYVDHMLQERRFSDLKVEPTHGNLTRARSGSTIPDLEPLSPRARTRGYTIDDFEQEQRRPEHETLGLSRCGNGDCGRSVTEMPLDDHIYDILGRLRAMAVCVGAEDNDKLDSAWVGPDGLNPLHVLLGCADPEELAAEIIYLAEMVREIAADEPAMAVCSVPAKVFGDIHGNFRDVLMFLNDFGFPKSLGPCFVFNGDFVDRGAHQLEVVIMLFTLKLVFPDYVCLNRGNHEDSVVSCGQGDGRSFVDECQRRLGTFGTSVFEEVFETFEHLPLACLMDGRVLVVHGGLGDGQWDLSQLQDVQKPLSSADLAADSMLYNILWSDPIPEDVRDSFGVHCSPRDNHKQMVKRFGVDVTIDFCDRNSVEMVVRSHQSLPRGHGYELMHSGRLMRVFSARDYEGNENDACILFFGHSADGSGKLVARPQVLKSLTKRGRAAAGVVALDPFA